MTLVDNILAFSTVAAITIEVKIAKLYPELGFYKGNLFNSSKSTRLKTRKGAWLSTGVIIGWIAIFVWWLSAV